MSRQQLIVLIMLAEAKPIPDSSARTVQALVRRGLVVAERGEAGLRVSITLAGEVVVNAALQAATRVAEGPVR